MRTLLTAILLLSLWLVPAGGMNARPTDAEARARELATLFNKSKHKVKERRGFRIEVNVEVKSEPVVRANAREYAGTYEAFSDYPLRLEVGTDGRINASGTEPGPAHTRRFILKDAKIEGALMTATKVYDDGATEKFEAVFIKRTTSSSTSENGEMTRDGDSAFGLGVVFDPPKVDSDYGFTLTRLFYEFQQ
jgi:hypothetical protein